MNGQCLNTAAKSLRRCSFAGRGFMKVEGFCWMNQES